MEEIQARAEKHVEAEEDQVERLEKGDPKRQAQMRAREAPQTFTPLREKRMQILHKICHTRLLEFPREVKGWVMGSNRNDWCKFHRAHSHSTKECQTLQA
ncbi:hypothetical protein CR513_26969, partial [Mucuna pruriens]